MSAKPKAPFWIVAAFVVSALVVFALFRANVIGPTKAKFEIGANPERTAPPGKDSIPAAQGSIEVSFYSSSAKDKWINEMVRNFNESRPVAGGKRIIIKAIHIESGNSLDQIKDGKIKPDIWSPGDESWLVMGQAYYQNVKQRDLYDRFTPLVNIPLVIAMWEPMARVLGYPKPIGWKDIAQIAASTNGWAAFGHPEWGKFRWGHAHPDANSGFLTIISEIYSALNKTNGLTAQDLKSAEVVSFLKEFEGAVEHYGLSNSWIDDFMHAKGPAYLSAAVQYENTIVASNAKNQSKPFKLVAIYPKEGTFWTRHPAAVLKGEWMTPEKEEAAHKFIAYLAGKSAQQRAMEMGLRPIMPEIEIASPLDESFGVANRLPDIRSFTVPDENVLKRIRDLWEDVKTPATIALLLDRSGSMKGMPIDNAKTGAIQFIQSMKPRDELVIINFNQSVSVLAELGNIQQNGEASINRIQGIFADGGTALHDAIRESYETLKKLKTSKPNRRYSILLLSDGRDTSSKMNRHDLIDYLPSGEEHDIPKIFAIAYGEEADKELLSEIVRRTNGRLFISSPEEIVKTYKELSANF